LVGLTRMFDLIVIDTPPLINLAAAAALDGSDSIALVLTPEVGAIHSTVAMLRVMTELKEKVRVVLNRISPQPGVPEAAIEKALRQPLAIRIPFDPAQAAALPQGKPLAWAQPESPLAVATQKLAEMLCC